MVLDSSVATRPLNLRFWLLTLAALAAAALTLELGFWQLSRASHKLALQQAMDERLELPALGNRALADPAAGSDVLHRRVRLRGRWLAQHTVYLDNRQMAGKQGFFVVTPLQLEDSELAVVVQRGWVQRSFIDRSMLTGVATPAGTVQIEGKIAPPPAKLYEFDASSGGNIRQNLDMSGFAREVGMPLAAFSVQQSGPLGDALVRAWSPVSTGVEKHYGYAFQWFALCGLIVFLYFWFQIVRRLIRPR